MLIENDGDFINLNKELRHQYSFSVDSSDKSKYFLLVKYGGCERKRKKGIILSELEKLAE